VRRLAVAVALLALAGCGGDDDAGAKADFIKHADAICHDGNTALAKFNAEITAAQRGSDERKVFAALSRLTQQAADASEPYLARLDALSVPAGDRDAIKAWIADARRQVTLVAALSRAFADHDQTKIATLSEQIDALDTRNNAFAKKYGMTDCGKRN